jgi:two-component system OmpR family response regulator
MKRICPLQTLFVVPENVGELPRKLALAFCRQASRATNVTGPTVVSALRGIGVQTPVIMVSSTSDIAQRIQALRAGADDYLVTPFSPDEMLARVEVLLQKRLRPRTGSAILRTSTFELNLVKRNIVH